MNVEKITWHDHYTTPGWHQEVPDMDDYIVNSVGFVVDENDKQVVLAQSVSNLNHFADFITILKATIKRRKQISK